MARTIKVEIFDSFEAENTAEHRRRARMTPEERWRELDTLQERAWGLGWSRRPLIRTASWETVDW